MTPEIREFLTFASIALKVQTVEHGVYHRGFIAYNTNTALREMSTQTFCAIIRAIRKLHGKPRTKYVDKANNVVATIDYSGKFAVRYGKSNRFDYYTEISGAMMQQLAMRQQQSGFRWIQRTKKGPKWITK